MHDSNNPQFSFFHFLSPSRVIAMIELLFVTVAEYESRTLTVTSNDSLSSMILSSIMLIDVHCVIEVFPIKLSV